MWRPRETRQRTIDGCAWSARPARPPSPWTSWSTRHDPDRGCAQAARRWCCSSPGLARRRRTWRSPRRCCLHLSRSCSAACRPCLGRRPRRSSPPPLPECWFGCRRRRQTSGSRPDDSSRPRQAALPERRGRCTRSACGRSVPRRRGRSRAATWPPEWWPTVWRAGRCRAATEGSLARIAPGPASSGDRPSEHRQKRWPSPPTRPQSARRSPSRWIQREGRAPRASVCWIRKAWTTRCTRLAADRQCGTRPGCR